MFKKTTNTPSQPSPDSQTPPKPKRRRLVAWLWRWVIAPLLVLVISFHLLIAAMLGVWKVAPVGNSMFMVAHRLSGARLCRYG
ncbi:hypothetical protein LP097_09635 [Moraxella bovis]|nr:hypothetical protein [Moraxella bovis]UZA29209.1 hypothetical protein LP097_09635 [Moraxella bovis]